MKLVSRTLAAALIAGGVSSLAGSADAVPLGPSLSLQNAAAPVVQTVQWRRGWGLGLGLAAGAFIGGAIAASTPYYGYGYGYAPAYYGYGYSSTSPAYGYGYAPGYSYGYGPAYYAYPAYRVVYPRYRTRVYVGRPWRRW